MDDKAYLPMRIVGKSNISIICVYHLAYLTALYKCEALFLISSCEIKGGGRKDYILCYFKSIL